MDLLQNQIEALIFCSPKSINIQEIQSCIEEVVEKKIAIEMVEESINLIKLKYSSNRFAFELNHVGGGYLFMTKPAYKNVVQKLLQIKSRKRLSTTAIETLSIIAYKQPITKAEIEAIRGVNCDYTVQRLLEKNLIEIRGKSDKIGRPLLFGTSSKFMEYFGINSVQELPTLQQFVDTNNIIEEQ